MVILGILLLSDIMRIKLGSKWMKIISLGDDLIRQLMICAIWWWSDYEQMIVADDLSDKAPALKQYIETVTHF